MTVNDTVARELDALVTDLSSLDDGTASLLLRTFRRFVEQKRRGDLLHPTADSPTPAEVEYQLRSELFEAGVRDGHTVSKDAAIAKLSESRVRHLLSSGVWPSVSSFPGSCSPPAGPRSPESEQSSR